MKANISPELAPWRENPLPRDADRSNSATGDATLEFGHLRVVLRQRTKFSGETQPTRQELDEMNHLAHEQCFIANSVKTEVTVEPQG